MAVSKAFLFLSNLKIPSLISKISSRKYLSSLEDAVLSLLSFACLFPLPLLVYVRHFRYWSLSFKLDFYLLLRYDVNFYKKVQRNHIVEAAKLLS